jgi:diphthine-ammonia ligase
MKVAVLFSGGKDSCLAMHKAEQEGNTVVCLISIISKNKESYMFHVPNIELTALQAKAIDIPILQVETVGEKEKELDDLKNAIAQAKEDMQIEGVVTGAVGSVYQASRVQKICDELELWCINPLWQMDQIELLNELLTEKFIVCITGIFGYPLDESWLGKTITKETIEKLAELQDKFKLNPAGEGGEIETTVFDGPIFYEKINPKKTSTEYDNHAGTLTIEEAELVPK